MATRCARPLTSSCTAAAILQILHLADETGLGITVWHLPPGRSQWNKIELWLFSHLSMNWHGRPLESHEVIGNSIAAPTTCTGLTVQAELDTRQLPQGHRGDGPKMEGRERCALRRDDLHGEWTYTLVPQRTHDPR